MVFQYKFWSGNRLAALTRGVVAFTVLSVFPSANFAGEPLLGAQSQPSIGAKYLKDASAFYESGQYFKAARYAFAAFENDPRLKPQAYAWVSMSLVHAGLPNAASYFFIRTLQSGNHAAIHSALTQTQALLVSVGADILRKYLIRHTRYEDYDLENRSAYLYALGKDALVSGDAARALGYLDGVRPHTAVWPFALHIRGTALAILGRDSEAIEDFKACAESADSIIGQEGKSHLNVRKTEREADDLRSRCIAGRARTLYQVEKFDEADRIYDSIPKRSFVWPDVLFEQAWNAFGLREYNRTLGKLVSYKSPALGYVYNSEIEVLRAQAYLAMCLYSDANEVVNEFNAKYTNLGVEIKEFVERNSNHLGAFYDLGKSALSSSLYSKNGFYKLLNRFVRGPSFQNLVATERQVALEMEAIRHFDATQGGVSHNLSSGFPGFLEQVLKWRLKTVQLLGGAFVKNSLLDYHHVLMDDYDKMAFIKLEMLKRAKDKLVYKKGWQGDRNRGSSTPERRDDQYRWSFNGEFWTDELGDYVFGLESECKS